MRSTLLALAAATFLAGCQSTVDSGPMTLSPLAEMIYQRAISNSGTAYVAVAVDGSMAGYSICTDGYASQCGGADGEGPAIKACERNSNGKKCYIYSHGKKVIWDFDGPALPGSTGDRTATDSAVTSTPETSASAVLIWDDGSSRADLDLRWTIPDRVAEINLDAHPSGLRQCRGELSRNLTTRKSRWWLQCAERPMFAGIFDTDGNSGDGKILELRVK